MSTVRGSRRQLLLGASLFFTALPQAFAVSFNIGEVEAQFDSSLSIGSSWATASPDRNLIGANNGGRGLSQTSDDGRLNFRRGQTFSKVFKGVHELELKQGDSGLFLRGKYWYDFELKDEGREFKAISDSNRKGAAQASGAELLDAFVYHNFAIGDQPGTVRLGRQVISWGESTFIGNGINSINPVDVSAFRRPGAQLKEGLIPVNLLYVSQSLTQNLSAEAFYQLDWQQTVVDNCGTFFSTSDVTADGCARNLAILPSLARSGLPPGASAVLNANGVNWGAPDEGVIVGRDADRDARNSGQFGVAMHYLYEPLDTDFGAYFLNYHSRLPIFSGRSASQAAFAQASLLPAALQPLVLAGNSRYFIEYPEDIHLLGLSFSTTLASGTAWSGELSYRPNAPVQLNTTDVVYSSLASLSPGSFLLEGQAGGDARGYRRKPVTQVQTTLTHFFDHLMGAERMVLVGEVGWTHVSDLESTSQLRYGRDPAYGPGPLPDGLCSTLNAATLTGAAQNNLSRYCENDGFTTRDSWGYRAKAIWEYNNVFAGVNLKPSLAWAHDVAGYSPGPGGNFEEGRKAVSLGLDAEYANTYTASWSYTNFFDGQYSTLVDRDFMTLSVGVNF